MGLKADDCYVGFVGAVNPKESAGGGLVVFKIGFPDFLAVAFCQSFDVVAAKRWISWVCSDFFLGKPPIF